VLRIAGDVVVVVVIVDEVDVIVGVVVVGVTWCCEDI